MEPYGWIGDVTTIEAFESGVLDVKDFYFTGDDYRYKIEIEAKKRFLELLKNRFNSGAKYKGKTWKWDTIILEKTKELSKLLSEKSDRIDFVSPNADLKRMDSRELRQRILTLSATEARRSGIGKSTCHYLRKHAESERLFKSLQEGCREAYGRECLDKKNGSAMI
jgi:CRISPR-associated protein Cas1